MKREKIINELEGQKKHILLSLSDDPIDRSYGDKENPDRFFTNPDRVAGYWYGRLVCIEEALRLLKA